MIQMYKVISSNVDEIGYDEEAKELHVRFKDGSLYIYSDFEPAKNTELIASDSKGSFIHKNIKGKYKFRKVSE